MSEVKSPSCVTDLLTSRRWPFSYGFHNRVKGRTGLYAFWTGNACLYVGKSGRDLGVRLYHHRMQEHNERLDQYFAAFGTEIEISLAMDTDCPNADVSALECQMIDMLRPITNINRPS